MLGYKSCQRPTLGFFDRLRTPHDRPHQFIARERGITSNLKRIKTQKNILSIFRKGFKYVLKMTGVAGFEPTSDGVKVRCLTAWLYPNDVKVKISAHAWYVIFKTKKHWWWGADSNCRTLRERIYSPPRLATSLPHQYGLKYKKYALYFQQYYFFVLA